jgi:DNA-binding protein HU-beta
MRRPPLGKWQTGCKVATFILRAETMNQTELIEHLSKRHAIDKRLAKDVLVDVVSTINDQLRKTGRISIRGLGTFSVIKRQARLGRNPQTGEAFKIKAAKIPRFKPSPALKDSAAKAKI